MQRNVPFLLLLVCFFLSGLAGLIYQTAWTREFAFVFGTSNLAVATVLAAYMAGLAAGAAVAARLAHRITRPLLTYGLLELGVGITALGVPLAIQASQALYVGLFGGQTDLPEAGGLSSAVFYMACSFVILMIPTALMGATLPLLVRHSVHNDEELSSRIGLLYSINTAGAVVGTVLAAFVLLPLIGLRETIWAAAAVNGLVFLAAWALARSAGGDFDSAPPAATSNPEPLGKAVWILPLIFGSGLVSFTYEVLWTRLLEHLLGGSVYAFSTMLASFLMGIALGAAVGSRFGTTRSRAAMGFAIAQLGIALLSAVAWLAVDEIPALTASLKNSDLPKMLVDWAASTFTLFPAAVLLGATFPFAVRILARDENEAASASAKVYAVNTLGSVVGSIGAGFFIIPALGYAGTLIFCVAINLLLALGTALTLIDVNAKRVQAVAAIGIVLLAISPPGEPLRILRFSPLANYANEQDPIAYLGVGRAATVLVLETGAHWFLRTNGNPEGRISPLSVLHNQAAVARWLGGLPSIARPDTETMLVVGFGGGVALETIPPNVKQIDVIELEPEVIAANASLGEQRWRDPLKDPRVKLHLNDARNSLTLTTRRFDAIVSQPSHPWSAGASHLYTQEFFELARDHLEPDGVFVQWIGLAFVDEDLFRTLLATLLEVYEYVQVYNPSGNNGVLFLASNSPFETGDAAQRTIDANPAAMRDLGVFAREDVLTNMLLNERGVRELAKGAEINRDDHNILQIRSPNVLDRSLRTGIQKLTGDYDPLVDLDINELNISYMLRLLGKTRADRIISNIKDPIIAKLAQVDRYIDTGKIESARTELHDALVEAPRNEEVRSARIQMSRYALTQGTVEVSDLIELPLYPAEAAVAQGWRAIGESDWDTLRSLDDELAKLGRTHSLSNHAASLRAEWRIETDDEKLGREALTIIDGALWDRLPLETVLLRHRASTVANDYLAALDSLLYLNKRFISKGARRAFVKRVTRELRKVPTDDPKIAAMLLKAEQKLRALSR
jgi:spermidine synthase